MCFYLFLAFFVYLTFVFSPYSFYEGAWKSLRQYRTNVDVLVVLSTTAAYTYSVIAIIIAIAK